MKAGSCFSGVGGLDLAVEQVFAATTAWHCEVDPNASKVLAARWPGVPNLGDITAIDWAEVEPVDIICGGSPCQDLSSAGARAGMRDGTRSGLWASMLAAIATIRPRYVIWENVRGALSACAASDLEPCPRCVGGAGPHVPVLRALGRVLGDLANLGFDAEWIVLPASAVGACHRRERVFVLAWDANATGTRLQGVVRSESPRDGGRPAHGGGRASADADSGRLEVSSELDSEPLIDAADRGACGGHADGSGDEAHRLTLLPTPRTSDTNGIGAHGDGGLDLRTVVSLLPTPTTAPTTGNGHARNLGAEVKQLLPTPVAHDSGNTPEDHLRKKPGRNVVTSLQILAEYDLFPSGGDPVAERSPDRWGRYADAIARHEQAFDRAAPSPTEVAPSDPRLAPRHPRLSAAFAEWMMGYPAGWVTDILDRAPALRCIGNGVMTAHAVEGLTLMLERAEIEEAS